MSGADLRKSNLSGAILTGVNFSGAILTNANLSGAILTDAILTGVNLSDAILTNAILTGVNLSDANLSGANLSGADLNEATLSSTNLRGAKLHGTKLNQADLSRALISNADLHKAELNGAFLSSADLNGANLSQANLSNANLNRTNLDGASLMNADLNGANLSQANLSNANLNWTHLSRAMLLNVKLKGANLNNANLIDAYTSKDVEDQLDTMGILGSNNSNVFDTAKSINPATNALLVIRILEEPLTTQNLTTIISSLTELYTKYWLIGKERFADLIEYTQTHDIRFVKETQLTIAKMTHNSPADIKFNIDLSASNIAIAIGTAIDGVVQTKQRLEKVELEIKEKVQVIEYARQKADQESKATLLEQEKQELAIERERLEVLEKRLEVQKKGIEFALEIASKTINMLQPNADEQTKAMAIQTLLPTLLQMSNGKGLELVLPAPQSQS